jgi:hypothetical protein
MRSSSIELVRYNLNETILLFKKRYQNQIGICSSDQTFYSSYSKRQTVTGEVMTPLNEYKKFSDYNIYCDASIHGMLSLREIPRFRLNAIGYHLTSCEMIKKYINDITQLDQLIKYLKLSSYFNICILDHFLSYLNG